MNIPFFLTLIGLPAAIGASVDAWISSRQKIAFRERMTQWCRRLYRTRLPDAHEPLASIIEAFVARFLGGKVATWRTLLISATISVVLTAAAYVVGNVYRGSAAFSTTWAFPFMLGVNIPFVWLAIMMTRLFIRRVIKIKFVWIAPAFLAYVCSAFLLAILSVFVYVTVTVACLQAISVHESIDLGRDVAGGFARDFLQLTSRSMAETDDRVSPDATVMLFACTTLIPAVLLTCTFLVLFVVTAILHAGRKFAWQWCEVSLSTEDGEKPKFRPFTVLGLAFGILGAIIHLFV